MPSEEGLTEPATIFATFKCASCHSLEAEVVRVGPTLDTANLQEAAADRAMTVEAFIMESIVDPAAFEKEEFPTNTMPLDFGTRMTAGQLRTLVEYLLLPGGEQ